MNQTCLKLTARDPLVSRDGRPFGAGQGTRMRSAGWLMPSVVAGSLRTVLGKASEKRFSPETAKELLSVEVAGVFPLVAGQLYLPAPGDCVLYEPPEDAKSQTKKILRASPSPMAQGAGCDLPHPKLLPVALTEEQASDDFKAGTTPDWWPIGKYVEWLTSQKSSSEFSFFDDRFLKSPEVEERTHVGIHDEFGSAEEGHLFGTAALPLTHLPRFRGEATRTSLSLQSRYAEIQLAIRARASDSQWTAEMLRKVDTLHPLGGERRLVHWETDAKNPWSCPAIIQTSLANTKRVRMVLATPAVFTDGYKPGWLDENLIGSPPGSETRLKLVGLSIPRWKSVSGWSLQKRGPKAVRRMVPAGGVYFFEVQDGPHTGTETDLAKRWLEPVSDGAQERHDGFGVATWGIW